MLKGVVNLGWIISSMRFDGNCFIDDRKIGSSILLLMAFVRR
jgi:hypothetical protein